jgi:hypothetical protein
MSKTIAEITVAAARRLDCREQLAQPLVTVIASKHRSGRDIGEIVAHLKAIYAIDAPHAQPEFVEFVISQL